MARLTLYFCDLCNEPSNSELQYKIALSLRGEQNTRGTTREKTHKTKSKYRDGEICIKCYESLVGNLEREATLPQAGAPPTRSEKKSSPARSMPTDDDGINVVPSAMTDERRRQINNEQGAECRHSTGFTMEDGMPHCKDCKEKVIL
jgi:hypothetical protein